MRLALKGNPGFLRIYGAICAGSYRPLLAQLVAKIKQAF
jgi:hypothetical protein